jgi:hypothetical protein
MIKQSHHFAIRGLKTVRNEIRKRKFMKREMNRRWRKKWQWAVQISLQHEPVSNAGTPFVVSDSDSDSDSDNCLTTTFLSLLLCILYCTGWAWRADPITNVRITLDWTAVVFPSCAIRLRAVQQYVRSDNLLLYKECSGIRGYHSGDHEDGCCDAV